jgi:hypothetical protein
MKKVIPILAILIAVSATINSYAYNPPDKKTKKHVTVTKYTCPMHPEVVKNKPGKCPKCGMKLVAMKSKKK